MIVFGPLLILLLILALLIWIVFSSRLRNKFKNKLITKIFLFTYAILLVLSVFVYEVFPHDVKELPIANVGKLDRLDADIYDGKIEDIDPAFIRENMKFDYSGKELRIHQVDGYSEVVAERKSVNDGVVEIKYIAGTVVDGLDLTDEVTPVKMTLDHNTLNLVFLPGQKDINFTMYKKEFVINQFTGKKAFDMGSISDSRYLYLKIPKDLKLVNTDDTYINYVGK
ncbi:hypothetical protein K0H71_14625 [Bacillus sp. IITD106]|nr:hypothetical protein [Bacillus sp. IITD106]